MPAMQTPGGRFLPLLLAGLAATAALKLATLGLARLDCWLLAPLIVAMAWPLWAYRREQLMFVRRLLLAGATTESGRLRRWLWRGTLRQSLGVVTALLWSGVMLLMAAQLTPLQWAILALDALHEIASPFVGTVARRGPVLLGNALLLLIAFVAHDYALGFADTRALSWNALVAQTMQAAQAGVACPTAGTLLGVAALADQLPRHAAMLLLPDVSDARARLLAWLLLLAVTGFGCYLFTRYLLGVQALLEAREPNASPRPGRLFLATSLAALALAGLWAAYGPRTGVGTLGQGAVWLAQAANPCGTASVQASSLQAGARQQLDAASRQALEGAMRSVDSGLDRAFAAADAGIDKYLDWYFSFIGSYTRMGALVIPGLEQHMRERFSALVFADSGFEQQFANLGGEADAQLLARIAAEAEAIGSGFAQQLDLRPCLQQVLRPDALPGLERDAMRMALSAAVALPLSRAMLGLALRTGAAVMAQASARLTVKAAAGAAGATTTKRGASVLLSAGAAGTVCAPGGPLALACAAVAGAITWLGVDMAMMAIDEALFRKSLRAELVEELQGQRQQLREALRSQLEQAAADYLLQAKQRIDKVFVPAIDG
jgi:hypothetical protein